MWRGHNKNAICWVFYCVNDGKDDGGNPQVIKCLLGYISFLHAHSPNTKERKALTTNYKTYEFTTLKKHVDIDHVLIVKIFEKEVSGPIKKTFEMQLAKKKAYCVKKCNI